MGKRNELLNMLRGDVVPSRQGDLSRETDAVSGAYVVSELRNGVREKLRSPILGYNGFQVLAQTEKNVGGRRVYEIRDDFDFLDKMGIPYVGRYCMMKDGHFDHFMTLEEALQASHQVIEPGAKKFGHAEGAIILAWYNLETAIVPLYAFFVGSKAYVTDSSWLANQLSGNNVFRKEFVFVDGRIDHLARREDYGEGDEEIVEPDEPTEEA